MQLLQDLPTEVLARVAGFVDDPLGASSFYEVFPDLRQFDPRWRDGTDWFVEVRPIVSECLMCLTNPYYNCPNGHVEFKGYLFRSNVLPPRCFWRDSFLVRLDGLTAIETLRTMTHKTNVWYPEDATDCYANSYTFDDPSLDEWRDGEPMRLVVEHVPLVPVPLPPLYKELFGYASYKLKEYRKTYGPLSQWDWCDLFVVKFAADVLESPLSEDDREWICWLTRGPPSVEETGRPAVARADP